jgi:hypothetical protein
MHNDLAVHVKTIHHDADNKSIAMAATQTTTKGHKPEPSQSVHVPSSPGVFEGIHNALVMPSRQMAQVCPRRPPGHRRICGVASLHQGLIHPNAMHTFHVVCHAIPSLSHIRAPLASANSHQTPLLFHAIAVLTAAEAHERTSTQLQP